jgi:hypothetical protein
VLLLGPEVRKNKMNSKSIVFPMMGTNLAMSHDYRGQSEEKA